MSERDLWLLAAEDDYRGYHRGPDAEYGASMDNPENMFPDIYEHPEYYDTYQPYDYESHGAIQSARGNPDKKISVYRALPLSAFKKKKFPANYLYEGSKPYSLTRAPLNNNDWITPSYSYAKEHGESNLDQHGPWTILHHRARAGDLYSEGNSIHEWAYNGPSTTALESSRGLKDRRIRTRQQKAQGDLI
jgi:hypothetical protein